MTTGPDLYRLVEGYTALGQHHRTGTVEDARTLDWFEAELRALGARTTRQAFDFERYEASWDVTLDGSPVTALPLFYAGTGEIDTAAPLIAGLPAVAAGAPPGWEDLASRARRIGATVAVVPTRSPGGLLMVPNRPPAIVPGDLPAILVAGALEDRLAKGRVRVRLSARMAPGASANVLGRVGDGPDRSRVLLTTPLSGWFGCAGERGTGIAVMLAVARDLAARGVPLLLSGNSGHELVDLGAHHLASSGVAARAVFHFGASVAAGERVGDGAFRLAGGLTIRTALDGHDAELATAFAPLGKTPLFLGEAGLSRLDGWVGEARVWRTLGRPLISMAGRFSLFHTPEDIPARATTADLLEQSYAAARDAALVLVTATGGR